MITLFDHALRLHRQDPGSALPRDGEPYPDVDTQPAPHSDPRLRGADVAALLDSHFARSGAQPADLAGAFRDIHVPIHRNDHITAAAMRADRERVRRTGRWLVRHGTDRNAVTVGLGLLATDWNGGDIPLIQTIGLLSGHFGPLAVDALKRRRNGTEALLWLADRVAGWGRVYVVEELCRRGGSTVRPWLLRHACAGGALDGYYAGDVADASHLHEAITGGAVDDAMIDHTGRLLATMADCYGMGTTLGDYPPAAIVLTAHAGHLARQTPTVDRYVNAAVIADELSTKPPERTGCDPGQRDRIVRRYLAVIEQPAWSDAVRAGLDMTGDFAVWFTGSVATRLGLTAFTEGDNT